MEVDGKRKPFNETGLYRAITLTVLTPVTAGVVAVGGAILGHHLFQPLAAYSQSTGGVAPWTAPTPTTPIRAASSSTSKLRTAAAPPP